MTLIQNTVLRQPLPYYPNTPGVYVLSDAVGKVLYIGRSKQLCRRASHITAMQLDKTKTNPVGLTHVKARLLRDHQEKTGQVFVEFIETDDPKKLEAGLIKELKPVWNNTGPHKGMDSDED